MNASSSKNFHVGETAQLSRVITERDIQQMAEITGDKNPLHLDEGFARETRFKGKIAHGLFSLGLISAVLGTKLPGPGAIYLEQKISFLAPVRPGDTLTAEVEVIEWNERSRIIKLETRCYTQRGEKVASGEATLLAPP